MGRPAANPDDWYRRCIEPHEDAMLRSTYRVVGHVEPAQDALQSAVLALWKQRRRLERHPNPRAFVLRVSLDAAHDELRRRLRRARREGGALSPETPADPGSGAFEQACAGQLRHAVTRSLAGLPKAQATAFLLRALHCESYTAIAGTLGCVESTARTHVQRAREALRMRLQGFLPHDLQEQDR